MSKTPETRQSFRGESEKSRKMDVVVGKKREATGA